MNANNTPQLCACGCGEMTLPGNTYVKGHNNVNKIVSSETKTLLSIQNLDEAILKLRRFCGREF